MVKGIDIFREYFNEYTDQYVLIGGAACSVSFEEQEINFGRTTKDLDVVLTELKVMVIHSSTDLINRKITDFLR